MRTIVKVGANYGIDTQWFIDETDTEVYTFEPTPELLVHLLNKFNDHPRRNHLHIFPFAVDIKNGFANFNVQGYEDWGCSSLYEFSDDRYKYWPNNSSGGKRMLEYSKTIVVPTIRLDTFMEIFGIQQIDELHTDTQGNDWNVLRSLGDKIQNVMSGECETTFGANLYKNVNNNTKEVISWLEEKGFICSFTGDCSGQEADVKYKRT
jgi:FkbM family methyltransferase